MQRILLVLSCLLAPVATSASAQNDAIDPATGLIIATGFETVKIHCTICHSAQFITLQRGDRDTWLAMIRWMQRTQGLWEFSAEVETTIVDYLADNYPPGPASRRPNLKRSLLPPNPHSSSR